MNFSKKLILAGLTLSFLLLPACSRRSQHEQEEEERERNPKLALGGGQGQADRVFDVYIYMDPTDPTSTKCLVDIDVATLWTGKRKNGTLIKQTVTWHSDDQKEYFVAFQPPNDPNSSPFDSTTFEIKAGKKDSGTIVRSGKYYKFFIYQGASASGTACDDSSDPGYYVKP
jgi:hypothetical protein